MIPIRNATLVDMRAKIQVSALLCMFLGGLPSMAVAQINVALGKSIIDGSGSWDGAVPEVGAAYNGGTFPARLVVDGAITEPADGAVTYWLGREYTDNEYFTLDLGDTFRIDGVELFNTHNRQFNDRGTDEFVLYAATNVDANRQLINPIPILAGNLADTSGMDVIEGEYFSAANGLTAVDARYLRFEALTYYSSATNGSAGLNELRVFSNNVVQANRAFGKPVIDGSGAWDGNVIGEGAAFDAGPFPATTVTDGSISDADGNLWLGREGVVNEYFTVDLGSPVAIQEILLRNSVNRQFNDRGTREFKISVSNAVDGNQQLVNPVEILQGRLGNSSGLAPLLENVFTADNGLTPTTDRYIRFETLGDTYFNGNVGLNEIEVYDQVRHAPTPMPRENLAYGKPVVDGSGAWPDVPFDQGSFPADRVADGSSADANTGRTSYWLGRELTPDESFTLDLGDLYTVDEVALTNTHNTQYNDRGTDEFVLYGAAELDGNNQLIDPVVLVSGNLSNVAGQVPIAADVFTSANGLNVADVRYLQFVALSYFSSATNGGAGLNDLAVFGQLANQVLGDFDGDGELTIDDIELLTAAVRSGSTQARYDVDGNGRVDADDRGVWVEQLKRTYYGDANLDGEFNSADFVSVFQAGQYEDAVAGNSNWGTGDWNGDGDFNSSDFVIAFQNGGYELGPRQAVAAAVPEPALAGLGALGFLTWWAVRRPRKQ